MSKKDVYGKIAPEGKNITKEQADEIAKLQIDGLYTGVDFVRHYPNGELLSRLIGFTGYDGKDWQALNMHMMKFYKEPAIKFVCIQMRKEFRLPHVDDGFKTGKKGASVELTIDLRYAANC